MTAARDKWQEVMDTNVPVHLPLGPNAVDRYINDPKRLGFMFARYKFAAKILSECESIVDCGCGDGMGTVMFLTDTNAESIVGVDFDAALISHAQKQIFPAVEAARPKDIERIAFHNVDFHKGWWSFVGGVCCLDVLEHVEPSKSKHFIEAIYNSLAERGIAVIGTPNASAAQYGSEHSKIGHINIYDHERLRDELENFFDPVFIFSMNDEVVHMGFSPMAHYLIAVCVK